MLYADNYTYNETYTCFIIKYPGYSTYANNYLKMYFEYFEARALIRMPDDSSLTFSQTVVLMQTLNRSLEL